MLLRNVVSRVMTAALLASSSLAFGLTDAQKDELYQQGIITVYDDAGHKKGHFEVKFMPGKQHLIAHAQKQWNYALDLMDDFLDKKDFWEDEIWWAFERGLGIIKREVVEIGVCAIPSDFQTMREKNAAINGQFGALPHKIYNALAFAGTCSGRTLSSIFGATTGITYAVVGPAAHILYRPIAAGTAAILGGTIWPLMAYTWNGTAWMLLQNSNEPSPGDQLTVTFVPETVPDHVVAVLNDTP